MNVLLNINGYLFMKDPVLGYLYRGGGNIVFLLKTILVSLRVMDLLITFSVIFLKRDNFYDFLFPFL